MPAQCPPPSSPARNTASSVVSGVTSASNYLGIAFALPVFPEIAIEHHAYYAHQQPALWRHHDPVGLQLDQPILLKAPQILDLGGKIAGEVHQIGRFYR